MNSQVNKTMIEVENLSKTFWIAEDKKETLKSYLVSILNQNKSKVFNVLTDVNFSIKQGEFVGIIGRNGSGKSTLLKLIADIYAPTSGKVKVNGRIIPFLELGVGFNPELSGEENIYLNGTLLGMTNAHIKQKYDEIVEYSGLEGFMKTPVKNYSSGMKVRLGFSIAIQTDGDIYLLDEIMSVGDAEFRKKSLASILELIEKKKTILYVTHSLASISKYCTRCLWLNRGIVKFDGSPDKALTRYEDALRNIEELKASK